jgi:HSP20 family molecular chaperone IbpA
VDVEKLHNEVLRAFNDSCVIATRQYSGRGFRPAADAYFEEDTREIVVRFDLAGMAMSDIELLVDRRRGRAASTSRSRWTTATSSAACAS